MAVHTTMIETFIFDDRFFFKPGHVALVNSHVVPFQLNGMYEPVYQERIDGFHRHMMFNGEVIHPPAVLLYTDPYYNGSPGVF